MHTLIALVLVILDPTAPADSPPTAPSNPTIPRGRPQPQARPGHGADAPAFGAGAVTRPAPARTAPPARPDPTRPAGTGDATVKRTQLGAADSPAMPVVNPPPE